MAFIVDTSLVLYAFHDNEIVEAKYHEEVSHIWLPEAETIVRERTPLMDKRQKCLLLLHAGDHRISISKDALKFFSSPAGTAGIAAAAILIEKWIPYLALYLLNKFRRKAFPYEVFFDRTSAIDWLLSLRHGRN